MATSLNRLTDIIQQKLAAQQAVVDNLASQADLPAALNVLGFMQAEVKGLCEKLDALQFQLQKVKPEMGDIKTALRLLEAWALWQGPPPPALIDDVNWDRLEELTQETAHVFLKLQAEMLDINERIGELSTRQADHYDAEIQNCLNTLKSEKPVDYEVFTKKVAPNLRHYIKTYQGPAGNGLTLLHVAVRAGQEELVKWMREQGADVLVATKFGSKSFPFADAPVNFSEDTILQLLPTEAECIAKFGNDFKSKSEYSQFQQQFYERCQFALAGNHARLAKGLLTYELCPQMKYFNGTRMSVLQWLCERPDHIKILSIYVTCLKRFGQSARLWEELIETASCEGLPAFEVTPLEAALFVGNTEAVKLLIATHEEYAQTFYKLAPASRPIWRGVLPRRGRYGLDKLCKTILEREVGLSEAHWESACLLINRLPDMVPAAIVSQATGKKTHVFEFPQGVYDDAELGRLKRTVHRAVFLHFTRVLMADQGDIKNIKEATKDFNRAETLLQAVIDATTVTQIWQYLSTLLREALTYPCEPINALRSTLLRLLMQEPQGLRAQLGVLAQAFRVGDVKGYQGMLLYATGMLIQLKVLYRLPELDGDCANPQALIALNLQQQLLNATCDYFSINYKDDERMGKFTHVEKDWQEWSVCGASLENLLPRLITFLEKGFGLRLESHRWCVVAAIASQESLRTAFGLSQSFVAQYGEDWRKNLLKTLITALKKVLGELHLQLREPNNNAEGVAPVISMSPGHTK